MGELCSPFFIGVIDRLTIIHCELFMVIASTNLLLWVIYNKVKPKKEDSR